MGGGISGTRSDTVTDWVFTVVKSVEKDRPGQDENGGGGYQDDPPHVIRFVVMLELLRSIAMKACKSARCIFLW